MELILGIIGILLSGILVIIFILDFWYKRKEDRKKKRKELLGPLYDDVEKKKDLIKNYKESPLYVLENLRPFVDGNPDTTIKFTEVCEEFPKIGKMINEFDKELEEIRKNYDTAYEKIRKKVIEKYEKDNVFKSEADAFGFNPKSRRELIIHGVQPPVRGLVSSILTGEVEYMDRIPGSYKSEYIEFIKKHKDAFLEIRKEIKEIKEGEVLYEKLYKKIYDFNEKIRKELKIDLLHN